MTKRGQRRKRGSSVTVRTSALAATPGSGKGRQTAGGAATMAQRLELVTKERDALRVCLLGLLNVPCTCSSADMYRTVTTRLLNAGRRASDEAAAERKTSDANELSAAAAIGAAASLLEPQPQQQHEAAVPAVPMDPLSEVLAEVGADEVASVHSDSTHAPVSPLPSGADFADVLPEDCGPEPTMMHQPPKPRVEKYDDDLLDAFLDDVALTNDALPDLGSLRSPLFASTPEFGDLDAPVAMPLTFGAVTLDETKPMTSAFKRPPPQRVDALERPNKVQRTMLFSAFFFLFALLSVPMWQASSSSSSSSAFSTDFTATTVQVGGIFSRGFGRDGGYYVAQHANAPTHAQPSSVVYSSPAPGRVLSSVATAPHTHQLASTALVSTAAKKRAAQPDDVALVVEDVKPQLRGQSAPQSGARSSTPLASVSPRKVRGGGSGGGMLRVFAVDDRSEDGAANLTLVPADAPEVHLEGVTGAARTAGGSGGVYFELSQPLQQYANAAFQQFAAAPPARTYTSVRHASSSSSASPNASSAPRSNASFVMCPEAFGSLSPFASSFAATPATPSTSGAGNGTAPAPPSTTGDVVLASGDAKLRHGGATSPHAGAGATLDMDSFPYLLLMVPSTAVRTTDGSTYPTGWLEIGCEVHSVRHVQSVHLAASAN